MAQVRKRTLRHFLFLDEELTREFLSQFEGGLYDTEEVRNRAAGSRGAGLKVGVAGIAGAQGQLDKESSFDQARTTHQTPASEFARLYEHLDNDELIQAIPGVDETIWTDLQPGELVEFPAVIALPGILKLAELTTGLMELLPYVQATQPLQPDALQAMKLFAELSSNKDAPLGVIASIAASPRFQFLCQLDRRFLRTEPSHLEGEATVLGKIQRKLQKGETVSAVEFFPGMNRLGRKQMREFERAVGNPKVPGVQLGATSITYPGAILTPVAVYR